MKEFKVLQSNHLIYTKELSNWNNMHSNVSLFYNIRKYMFAKITPWIKMLQNEGYIKVSIQDLKISTEQWSRTRAGTWTTNQEHQQSLSSPGDTFQNIRWEVALPLDHVIPKWNHPTMLGDSRRPSSKKNKTSTKEIHDSANIHVTQLTNTSDSKERVSSHSLRWIPWYSLLGLGSLS